MFFKRPFKRPSKQLLQEEWGSPEERHQQPSGLSRHRADAIFLNKGFRRAGRERGVQMGGRAGTLKDRVEEWLGGRTEVAMSSHGRESWARRFSWASTTWMFTWQVAEVETRVEVEWPGAVRKYRNKDLAHTGYARDSLPTSFL